MAEKIERTFNVPLRAAFVNTPKYKRTNKAVKTLREFLAHHMKTEKILIGKQLNNHMWANGIKNPPHHVKITVIKEDDVVKAELVGHIYAEPVQMKKKEKASTLKDKIMEKMGGPDEEKTSDEGKVAANVVKEDTKETPVKTEAAKTPKAETAKTAETSKKT
ncbi:MAG: 50S ribosomal protein L31e, partial [Nanoarchaeota archaeon]